MKIVIAFLSLVFAIYLATRGVNLLSEPSNNKVLIGLLLIVLALGVSYVTVKSLLKTKNK